MILKLQRGPISILKVIKGQHSVNNIGGIKVCSLCIFSVEALYLYNVLWKYFPQHLSYREDILSMQNTTKEHNLI